MEDELGKLCECMSVCFLKVGYQIDQMVVNQTWHLKITFCLQNTDVCKFKSGHKRQRGSYS
jgi:hypothetical protein